MVKVGRFCAYSLLFLLAVMYLAPKASLYYFCEESIKPYSVVINNESVQESGLGLEITDATIFIKSIESAKISRMKFNLFLLFNSITIDDITLSSVAASVIPVHIQHVQIRHSLLNPLEVKVYGEGDMGVFQAGFHLLDKTVKVALEPSEQMLKDYKSTLSQLKQSENGEYLYEKTI